MNNHDNPTQETQAINAEAKMLKRNNPTSQPSTEQVQKDFRDYLCPPTEIQLIPQPEFQEAFVCGYSNAMHKTHTISNVLFLTDLSSQKEAVKDDLTCVMPLLLRIAPKLTECVQEYLYYDTEFVYRANSNLLAAFVSGYLAGIHRSGKYDRCLFLEGIPLVNQILGDLLAHEQSEENARRAAARIVVNRFGIDKDKFRDMIFTSEKLDAEGKPIDDKAPFRAMLFEGRGLDENGQPVS